jgi:hypothetical protein
LESEPPRRQKTGKLEVEGWDGPSPLLVGGLAALATFLLIQRYFPQSLRTVPALVLEFEIREAGPPKLNSYALFMEIFPSIRNASLAGNTGLGRPFSECVWAEGKVAWAS